MSWGQICGDGGCLVWLTISQHSLLHTQQDPLLFSPHLSLPMCAKVTHTAATSSLCDLPYTVETTRRGKNFEAGYIRWFDEAR